MPGLDGTGPRGMGPMTGGGRGFCNPNSPVNTGMPYRPWGYGARVSYGAGWAPPVGYGGWGAFYPRPYMGFGFGPGWSGGMGFGRGMGPGFAPNVMQPDPRAELEFLEGQAEALDQQLAAVRARITDLRQATSDQSE